MIERHVVSFDLSQRLKAAGFPQECYFAWWQMEDGSLRVWNPTDHSDYETGRETLVCAAPLLSEVMEQMSQDEPVAYCGPEGWSVAREGGGLPPEYGLTGPDAAALLWLALKEGK